MKHVAIMGGPNDYEGMYEEVLIDVLSSFGGAKPIIVKLEARRHLKPRCTV